MLNVEIKYNSAIDFLFSIVRINYRTIIRKNESFSNFEFNDEIEKYVENVSNSISPMMASDFEMLTKKFTGGVIAPVYLCIKNNISSITSFLKYFEKLSGEDFFRLYEEAFGVDSSKLTKKEFKKELKKKLNGYIPSEDDKIYFELKKYADETKDRIFNLLNNYYNKYYKLVEEEIILFMKQRTNYYKTINTSDSKYFLSKILLFNTEKLDNENSNIVLFPSYFYEIGWSQFFYKNITAYVYGYLLEQQLDKDFMKKKCQELHKILADEKRIEILKLLSKKKYYSAELAEHFDISKPTMSYHVNKMLSIGILNMEFESSNKVYLSLNKEVLKEMIEYIYNDIVNSED